MYYKHELFFLRKHYKHDLTHDVPSDDIFKSRLDYNTDSQFNYGFVNREHIVTTSLITFHTLNCFFTICLECSPDISSFKNFSCGACHNKLSMRLDEAKHDLKKQWMSGS